MLRREALRRSYLEVLIHLGQLYFDRAQYDRATEAYRRAIAHDSYLEAAHRELIRCYARQGEPGQAIRHYQNLVELLHDELDLSPAAETAALFEQLRQGEEL